MSTLSTPLDLQLFRSLRVFLAKYCKRRGGVTYLTFGLSMLGLVFSLGAVAAPASERPCEALACQQTRSERHVPRLQSAPEPFSVLVFTKTAGFRHSSISAGLNAVKALGDAHGFAVEDTEDAVVFTDEGLAPYTVVIFLNTTRDVLNEAQQAAFERFIQGGNGFVGVHAATDTEYDWAWYGGLVGAYFAGHPRVQEGRVDMGDATHPSTERLPDEWTRTDEWYSFRSLQETIIPLLLLDESSYDIENARVMHDYHPISWYHEYDGGRAWYTGMGHTSETYEEPLFLDHLLGGILWAAGAADTVPLPVTLTHFTALQEGDDVVLRWETASERNNAGFEVEHRLQHGFERVGFVAGAGTSTEPRRYRHRVHELAPGRHMFRLRQIDVDGRGSYGPEVEIDISVRGTHVTSEVHPNPFATQAEFSLAVTRTQPVQIQVYNVIGQVVAVLHDGLLTSDQVYRFELNSAAWPSGVYLVRLRGASFDDAQVVFVSR